MRLCSRWSRDGWRRLGRLLLHSLEDRLGLPASDIEKALLRMEAAGLCCGEVYWRWQCAGGSSPVSYDAGRAARDWAADGGCSHILFIFF